MKALLILQDGTKFEGAACGAQGTVCGSVAVERSVVGYQELVCDIKYAGKLLLLTYPLIGNSGVVEPKEKTTVKGLIVREMSNNPSNWREAGTFGDFLKDNNVVAIEGVDTRELTAIMRDAGNMKAIITTEELTEEQISSLFGGAQ